MLWSPKTQFPTPTHHRVFHTILAYDQVAAMQAAAADAGANAHNASMISTDPGTVLSELQIPPQCTYMHGASAVAAIATPVAFPVAAPVGPTDRC